VDCREEFTANRSAMLCDRCADIRSSLKAERDNERRKLRLCRLCGEPAAGARRTCLNCVGKGASAQRALAARRRGLGLCTHCGRDPICEGYEPTRVKYALCERCHLQKRSLQAFGTRKHWALLKKKLIEQEHRYPYSGDKIILGRNDSLDHILPRSRYPGLSRNVDNTQWVTKQVNHAKNNLLAQEFIALALRIAKHASLKTV
jgi:hypothetical protein